MWLRNIFRRTEPAPAPGGETGLADLPISPQVFAQLNRLRLRTSRRLHGAGGGQRPSTRRRPAADFREHRKYVPGDDIRFVDWKASGRSEQVFLKQGEAPQETTVHLLLDTSASMDWGDPSRRAAALQLAAMLGYLALHGDDRLHLLPLFDADPGGPHQPHLLKGKGQFPAYWSILRRLPFGGMADLAWTLRQLTRSSRGGVVLILSDLLAASDLNGALALLPPPAWDVTVLHLLHPQELQPAELGEVELVDAETGALASFDVDAQALQGYTAHLQAWRTQIETACAAHRAFYTLVPVGWSLERDTIPHLLRTGVLEPA